ncbi:MAG: hypothetical protein V3V67_17325, partial [Myxococcota bacterium]
MRAIPACLTLLCLTLGFAARAADTPAERLPGGATAYLELDDLAAAYEQLRASPLGEMLPNHPAVEAFATSPDGLKLRILRGMLYGATGQDAGSLLRSLVSDQAAVALYPGSRPGTPRWLAAV